MAIIKDKYILALQFAEKRGDFTLQDLVSEICLDNNEEQLFAIQIHEKQIFHQNVTDFINSYKTRKVNLHFSVEDKFRLLNFEALEDARASSREAKYFAIVALLVSIFTGSGSIYMAKKQIDSEINIPEQILKEFRSMNKDVNNAKILLSDIKKSIEKENDRIDHIKKK